ncbi:carotenoid 1,2-hydratase [Bermanella marisrubri]|uniref:AttH domain-containing protein n=1 Tax=Bermanella marisrubri TaxID=207949 RepID=Q1N063_9GAMM|nr:lipocalin-like domain-containing protein [Bermanella marisrubri]EAT11654.1 hypothetical protein RED65_08194 [Oceanobacter sp. RED65] [Bermanella marisrubri]QIZ83306.1 carotenoid 1,2-hydratase [Bermanella marisrubri]
MKYRLLCIYLIVLSTSTITQTSSVLKQDAETRNFANVVPGVSIDIPKDHLPHPDFRIEWWYFTANVWDKNGKHYGLQFTLFRQALAPAKRIEKENYRRDFPWRSRQSWMAHSAINSSDGHFYEERFARGGIGQAGVIFNQKQHFEAWIDDWQWQGKNHNPVNSSLSFSVKDHFITLTLNGDDKWIKHGDNGFSQKSTTEASYYYSHPEITVAGAIQMPNGERVNINGQGWLDREWSSQFLTQQQKGWDWLSIQLNNGARLMLFQLRDSENKTDFQSGTWINKLGDKIVLTQKDIALTPTNYSSINTRNVPTEWKLDIKKINKNLLVKAYYENSWLDTLYPYWEGPIKVINRKTEKDVGVGFMEMTGY